MRERFQVTRLENGLTVATAPMPDMLSVSVGLWFGIGSRYEPAQLNGACHFIEHMVFKGTHKRSAKQISQAIEGLGGYLNAFTSEESTCVHARAAVKHLPALLDVLGDMLLHSVFDPAELKKEREVIKEEIAMYLDEPQHRVQELLNETVWPGQPLGRPITGTAATLDGLNRPQLLEYLKQNYVASNAVLAVAGKTSHRSVLNSFAGHARRFRRIPKPAHVPVREDQTGPRVALYTKKTEQTQLALGIRTCSRHDERRFPLRLLNVILGENMSSRLFQVLREDLGLAYSVYSTPSFFSDTGDLVIYAGLDAGNLGQALRLVIRELNSLKDPGPTRNELQRAKDYVLGQIDLSLEGTESRMNWIGEQLLSYGRVFTPAQVKTRLCKVQASDIRRVAADFFRRDRLCLALVSPLKSDAEPARLLKGAF